MFYYASQNAILGLVRCGPLQESEKYSVGAGSEASKGGREASQWGER